MGSVRCRKVPFANESGVPFLCSENGTEERKSPSSCELSPRCTNWIKKILEHFILFLEVLQIFRFLYKVVLQHGAGKSAAWP